MTPAVRYATVNGLRLRYLEWGTPGRRPLLLLHGIARHAHTFDHLAPHFASDHHVIAVDMRGHGDSAWDPKAEYLVEDYHRDIEALVAQLGLRGIVLWGNSTGGRVVQVFAGSHPGLVAAVIVPSFEKAALSVGILSGMPRPGASSVSTTVSPLRPLIVTGAISSLNPPLSIAALARLNEASAKSSMSLRVS